MWRTVLSLHGFTVQRLSKTVTLFVNDAASPAPRCPSRTSGEHKPLLLLLPWLGSRPHAVTKYCEIYLPTGCDVLVIESEVQHFLWPRWALDHGLGLLELLQSDRFASRPLLVHAFSIGGFTYSQLLVHMSRDKQKYQTLAERIKGQVYDSMVVGSVEKMASGLGKTVFPRLETVIKHAALLYFSMFRHQTVDYFNTCIDAFTNSPVKAPALFLYCENDVMSDPRATEELIEHLRKRGIDVTSKHWEESTHAGHLKRHRQEYLTTLNMFLRSIHMVPLKAKL